MHTLLPMQLAILLMVLYIASAGLAIIPITGRFSSAPLTTLIIGGIFPFQLACVIIMEIIHLCIRTRRKRTTKCFLTWVRCRQLYGYSLYNYTVNKAILYIIYSISDWLLFICIIYTFIKIWSSDYIIIACTMVQRKMCEGLIWVALEVLHLG